MIAFPNAKINIGLNIVEKRFDGFHNLTSCFYPVGWSDALEITLSDQLEFKSDGIQIPGDASSNLCLKAYQLLAHDYKLPPVSIHLLKSIPIGAGLGGGSADAAFTITLLNKMFELGIPEEKQLDYARKLGSDCAFFIKNKPTYCFDKGDRFEPIELSLSQKWIVLINPNIHISTAEAYSGVVPKYPERDLRECLQEPIIEWKHYVKNDFEQSIFPKYPVLQKIKDELYDLGALYAAMSGSGSTLFGIFEQENNLSSHFSSYNNWQGFLS